MSEHPRLPAASPNPVPTSSARAGAAARGAAAEAPGELSRALASAPEALSPSEALSPPEARSPQEALSPREDGTLLERIGASTSRRQSSRRSGSRLRRPALDSVSPAAASDLPETEMVCGPSVAGGPKVREWRPDLAFPAPGVADIQTQEDGHRVWSIIRLFFESYVLYQRENDSYDEKVESHAEARNTERENLRLSTSELAALLDFKNLETLRDRQIFELKELCHEQFRTEDSTDIFDRYVSEIFHEISILKEEHYTLKVYGVLWDRDCAQPELQHLLDDAHVVFPRKLAHIRYLFEKAFRRLQDLLPGLAIFPIVARSLFLCRDESFIREVYPDGLHGLYRSLFRLGPFEGYYRVGLSFYQSCFRDLAIDAFERALPHFDEAVRSYASLCEHDRDPSEGAEVSASGDDPVDAGGARSGSRAFPRASRDPESLLRSIQAKLDELREASKAAKAVG